MAQTRKSGVWDPDFQAALIEIGRLREKPPGQQFIGKDGKVLGKDGQPIEVADGWRVLRDEGEDKRWRTEAEAAVWIMLSREGFAEGNGHLHDVEGAVLLLPQIAKELGVRAVHSATFRYLLEDAAISLELALPTTEGSSYRAGLRRIFRAVGPLLGHVHPVRRGAPRKVTNKGQEALEFFRQVNRRMRGRKESLASALRELTSSAGVEAARRKYNRGKSLAAKELERSKRRRAMLAEMRRRRALAERVRRGSPDI